MKKDFVNILPSSSVVVVLPMECAETSSPTAERRETAFITSTGDQPAISGDRTVRPAPGVQKEVPGLSAYRHINNVSATDVVCAEMEGTEIGIKNRTNMRTLFAIDELGSVAHLDA